MKTKLTLKGILIMIALLGVQLSTNAQAITADDVLKTWDNLTRMVVESAKLMPAEHFNYTPGEPLRSFADQINHTTRSNIGFAASVKAGRPTFPVDPSNPPKDKAAVIDLLEKSFQHFKSGLEKLSDEDLSETVPWGRRGSQKQITRLKAILIVTSHLQREHGKTMIYLREKGVAPAAAGSWTF
ncbi:DinB family protein [Roseivirga sp. E12]|uniref:DinB family protein n=1 Tax=Roseivirga sp. E12 TaxID=2819237 RepID=UPI001ABC207E|nr:DinB family protein [Roseivirga sp. E12]MBO3697346.1 DinB family protein [Roseivirga sp. E12]